MRLLFLAVILLGLSLWAYADQATNALRRDVKNLKNSSDVFTQYTSNSRLTVSDFKSYTGVKKLTSSTFNAYTTTARLPSASFNNYTSYIHSRLPTFVTYTGATKSLKMGTKSINATQGIFSGQVTVGNGSNIIYYCDGGISVGNLCRGNGCSCVGGSWVATSLKID